MRLSRHPLYGINAMSNFFAYQTAAERYSKARPYFHPLVVERFRQFAGLDFPLERALDVACGTGQSTQALADIARSVVGIDVSAAMIEQAPFLPNVTYEIASAEDLPFDADAFDLVTVGLAFHWFDQDRFLREAARVLRQGAWLLIYHNGISGRIREEPTFETWMKEKYWQRYPTPPRGRKELGERRAGAFGFALEGQETYANEVTMSGEEFVHYLLTQSNVISAVEEGGETAEDVAAWLRRSVAPFFGDGSRRMIFGGSIWYLRKLNAI